MGTMAEMEVGRGLGYSPRMMGNIMSSLQGSLRGSGMQSKMLHNLRAAHNTEAEGVLFDSHGALRSEYQSGIGLARGLQTAFHGDSTAMQNVFAGTGAGNAQSLQANQRRALAAFMGEGSENVRRMVAGAGADFTEQDVSRGAGIFGSDETSRLNTDRENREDALVGNTTALNNLSNAIQSLGAAHPLAGAAANAVGGGAMSVIGSKLLGSGASAAAGGPAAVTMAARIAAAGGGLGAGVMALGAAVGGVVGQAGGDVINRSIDAVTNTGSGGRGRNLSTGADSILNPATLRAFASGIREAFGSNPITVNLDPHALAQSQAQAASGANAPPPESRH